MNNLFDCREPRRASFRKRHQPVDRPISSYSILNWMAIGPARVPDTSPPESKSHRLERWLFAALMASHWPPWRCPRLVPLWDFVRSGRGGISWVAALGGRKLYRIGSSGESLCIAGCQINKQSQCRSRLF